MSSFGIRKSTNYIVSSASYSNYVIDPSSNWTFNANNIYNNNIGNVGIGTSTPGAILDVNGQAIIRTPIVKIGSNAGLNNAVIGNIAIGNLAGNNIISSSSINIGTSSGGTGQSNNCISIGTNAGACNLGNRGITNNAIAIGGSAGQTGLGGRGVCIGNSAGSLNAAPGCINIGQQAGQSNQQGENCIAIGRNCADVNQGGNSIAFGACNVRNNFTANSIAFGVSSVVQNASNIMFNATGSAMTSDTSSALFVKPISSIADVSTNFLVYNPTSGKVSYNTSSVKSFIIDHPLENDKYLVHACLEGPEAGVYYRGESEITNNEFVEIELPSYTSVFYNFTVHVSPVESFNNLYASRVDNGKFKIFGINGKVSWTVFATRQEIDVEPLKSNVNVNGQGPYKYIE